MTSAFGTATLLLRVLIIAFVVGLAPSHATAQDADIDPGASATAGPLRVDPSVFWLTEYDDNVYRSGAVPISDVISTIGAKTEMQGRMRKLGLTASGSADWVHYSKLMSERGANVETAIRAELLFTRFVPYVSAAYDNSRQRVNPEIDNRPRYEKGLFGAGGIVHVGVKTSIDMSVVRSHVTYDDDASVDGVPLDDALNHSSDQITLSFVQQVSALTRLTVSSELHRDDFGVSSHRTSDNFRVTTGFDSDGVIKGHARAGVQVRKPRDPSIPEAREFYVSAGTTVTLADGVQLGVDVERDLMPSYRTDIAYYDSFGYGGSLSYALVRSLRLSAMARRRIADYRSENAVLVSPEAEAGIDKETSYGAAVSYLLGHSMAIDLTGRYTKRSSPYFTRRFDGLSFRAGISHAF